MSDTHLPRRSDEPAEKPRSDPALEPRSNYDYQSEDVEHPELLDALDSRVDGEVRFDSYTRNLYATDASAYQQLPIGVVAPAATEDVQAVMTYCAEEGIPVLPRGGGTSLAGQAVNEAVVLDFKKEMDAVLDVDPDNRTVRAQTGITLAQLNNRLEPHGLKFAPDPAWGDKSVLGGCIGNNSTGAHSLKYHKADGYIESVEAVLADGTVTEFGWISVDELHDRARSTETDEDTNIEDRIYTEVSRILREEREEIEQRYPDLTRNVSGYNLDKLLEDADERGEVNVGRLLAGSEGTLAIVTEATVSLEPIPEEKAAVLLTYDDILDAMADVAPILEHEPAAVEVMDNVFLELAAERPEFESVVGLLPDGTDSTLLVEFYADSPAHGEQQVADLLMDRLPDYEPPVAPTEGVVDRTDEPVYAVDALEAYDADRQAKFWKMRKAGLPILLSRTGDDKHWPFVEDTAIPAEHLDEYVADLEVLFDELDTFASYYAHAGPGVLHIRPLVNLKTEEGLETVRKISDAVTDLVIEYGGSVSGEHGDGRARTQYNRKLYGDRLWETFRDLKTAFDPDWLLNPGNVCGEFDLTENLRFDPEYSFDAGFEPELAWDNENGFQGMVELCHGCAGCTGHQETTGGVMCPTYRAADEEILSTRGRANALRQAMNGDLPEELTDDEFVHEVLDLCIGCKGCRTDCPSGVDMAKLKAEVKHEHHQREGVALRDRLFANVETLYSLGSTFAPLSNWATSLPGSGLIAEKTLGIARERDLPTFERETLQKWDRSRAPLISEADAERKALLVADPYTNYTQPEVGKAAVRALEAAGVHVEVPDDVTDSGRPAHSKSLLDSARDTARENVDALAPRVEADWDIVTVEPSDAVMYQLDYLDLLSGDDVEAVAANTYGILEYLDTFRLDEGLAVDGEKALTYHGHCQQKATTKDHHAVNVLRRAGFEVDALDSTCCGMAGSFGYEAEHYSMSTAIADLLFGQIERSPGEQVVAPGTSCRAQLLDYDGLDGKPPHPIEVFEAAIQQ